MFFMNLASQKRVFPNKDGTFIEKELLRPNSIAQGFKKIQKIWKNHSNFIFNI